MAAGGVVVRLRRERRLVVLDVSHREDVVLGGGASLSKNDLAAPIDIGAAMGGKD